MAIRRIILLLIVCVDLAEGKFTNIARNKPASMSSTFSLPKHTFTADKGVDGDKRAELSYVIQTNKGQKSAWWKVDLQAEVQDATVKIYFRKDYKWRRNGVQFYTSTNPFSSYPSGQLCATVTGRKSGTNIPDVVTVNCSGSWSYLMVYTQTRNNRDGPLLDFAEIEVLVCTKGTYSMICNKSCDSRKCAVTPTSCDRYTGACPPGGCQAGWMGTDCTEACPSGKYGANCVKKCGHCNGTCNVVDGQCLWGCLEGYCDTQCTNTLAVVNKASTGLNSVTAAVIGAVIGSLAMLVVCGGLLVCLVRCGRLQWIRLPGTDRESTITANVQSSEMSDNEYAGVSPVFNNEYAILDTETNSETQDYDALRHRTCDNT